MKGKKQKKEPAGMNPAEIFAALALLEKERGIPQTFMMEKIIQAITTAYKRDHDGVENVIYDETVYELVIEVIAGEDGSAAVLLNGEPAEEFTAAFENSYGAAATPEPTATPAPTEIPESGELPKTGDDSPIVLYAALFGLLAVSLVVVILCARRKRR